jgi:hypothetical protein
VRLCWVVVGLIVAVAAKTATTTCAADVTSIPERYRVALIWSLDDPSLNFSAVAQPRTQAFTPEPLAAVATAPVIINPTSTPRGTDSFKWTDGAEAYSACASAFFARALIGVTVWQARLTRTAAFAARDAAHAAIEQSRLSKLALEIGNRPHLLMSFVTERRFQYNIDADPNTVPEADIIPFIEFRWHNYGRSPAIVKETLAMILVSDKIISADRLDEEFTSFDYEVIPAGTSDAYKPITAQTWDSLWIEDVKNRRKWIFFLARIIYTDVSGGLHETPCCWIYDCRMGWHEHDGKAFDKRT